VVWAPENRCVVDAYFRGYKANEGIIEADVRSVNADQLNIVYRRISEVLGQEKKA